jgi:hypothetical protein
MTGISDEAVDEGAVDDEVDEPEPNCANGVCERLHPLPILAKTPAATKIETTTTILFLYCFNILVSPQAFFGGHDFFKQILQIVVLARKICCSGVQHCGFRRTRRAFANLSVNTSGHTDWKLF